MVDHRVWDKRAVVLVERTPEGFYRVRGGMAPVVARGLAYAPYADLIWVEADTPDLAQAREFAEAVHARYPGRMLAYNCSPSFNWKAALDDDQIAKFQREAGAMGYRFQFITPAGFHSLNHGMFAEYPWAALDEVRALFERTALEPELPLFFTLDAYTRHLARHAEVAS